MAKQKSEAELTRLIKAYANKVASELPERLTKGQKSRRKVNYRKHKRQVDIDRIEQSYNQLDGEWREWLEVARRYERKVLSQDRLDTRHNIMIELAVKVCILNGLPKIPDYSSCSFKHKPSKCRECAFLAIRPIQSLDSEVIDGEGNKVRLLDTVASDKALDLPDTYYDVKTWLLGCPVKLVQIANKKLDGKPLDAKDRMYLMRYRRQEQKSLF